MLIAFRTEGNHGQGMGDVLGCIAMAQAAVAVGDTVHFIIGGGAEAAAAIRAAGFDVSIAPAVADEIRLLGRLAPAAVVVNKLNNDRAHIRALSGTGALVVTLDDVGPGAAEADVRVNVLYGIEDAVTGPEYITLRKAFRDLHVCPKAVRPVVESLLVAQGGADTHGFLPRIVDALRNLHARPRVQVVVGPVFRHDDELRKAISGHALTIDVLRNPSDLPRLMWEADLAVTAAGLMMFEFACVGTPAIVVCAERFEVETADRLAVAGAVSTLGFGGDLDYAALPLAVDALASDAAGRHAMAEAGRAHVDGDGARRVIALVRERAGTRSAVRP